VSNCRSLVIDPMSTLWSVPAPWRRRFVSGHHLGNETLGTLS